MKETPGSQSLLEPGELVDHYKVVRLIGRGGMGEVYLARDTNLGRKVALKLIRPERMGSPEAIERFMLEARTTALFSHPHIITIYGVGNQKNCPYLALEYLEGQTLQDRMDEESSSIMESLRIGLAITKALLEAHSHQVIHRDLKPQNVFMAGDGRLRVLDFGLAKALDAQQEFELAETLLPDDIGSATSTVSQLMQSRGKGLRGTPAYMAPEQWEEQPATEATDVWALGLIFHQLIAGRLPYKEPTVLRLAAKVLSEEPVPSLSPGEEVPGELAALINSCLAKKPDQRPTVKTVLETIEGLLSKRQGREGESQSQSPFRGLLPFDERHTDLFFGRDDEIATFVERLREEAILPVVGPSGAGKSSFVQAGVIPRLKEQGRWLILRIRPGNQPLKSLAARVMRGASTTSWSGVMTRATGESGLASDDNPTAESLIQARQALEDAEMRLISELRQSPTRLNLMLEQLAVQEKGRVLLFVDQIEEVYTLVEDDEERRLFMEAVCTAADDPQGPVRVLFTLRDDFMGRLADTPEAREALSHVLLMRSPGSKALKEILIRPVETTGYRYQDDNLVTEMVEAVQNEVAALPLLEFTGQKLWERRDRKARLLTRKAYDEIGGVAGALAHHADAILEALPEPQFRIARLLLLKLVTAEGTRRVVPRAELLEGREKEAGEVLNRLVKARLLQTSRGQKGKETELEIVHETLLSTWGRLARWIEEDREELSFLVEVGQAADLWEKRGCRDEEVWYGEALYDALQRSRRCTDVPEKVQQFMDAGERRERKKVRRKRVVLAGTIVILTLVAIVLALLNRETQLQRDRADAQRKEAEKQRATAQLEGSRAAFMRGALIESRAKLRGALEAGDSTLARAIWQRLGKTKLYWKKQLGTVVYNIAFSPNGQTVAVASQDRSVYLIDVRTQGVHILRGHKDQVTSVAFSPKGRYLASSSWGGEIRLWDLGRRSHGLSSSIIERKAKISTIRILKGHKAGIRTMCFSPDGLKLVSGSSDKTIYLWNVTTGAPIALLKGHRKAIYGVSFSRGGRLLASASSDRTVRLWNVADGRSRAILKGHTDAVLAVDFSPDQRLLASSSRDRTIRLWHASTGKLISVLRGHKAGVRSVSFSPDGKLLASAGRDKTVRLWDVSTGRNISIYQGHKTVVYSVHFNSGGKLLASAGFDKTVRLWNIFSKQPLREIKGHHAEVYGVSFSPDGKQLASASRDKTIRLWNVSTGLPQTVLTGHKAENCSVDFSPDGRLLASASWDKTVRLWKVATGSLVKVLKGHTGLLYDVTFSPKGRLLASTGIDGSVRLWDVSQGTLKSILKGNGSSIRSLDFSPDGRLLASAGYHKHIRLWDIARGSLKKQFKSHKNVVYGVNFSPDGQRLATVGYDGTVRIWEVGSGSNRILGHFSGRIYAVDFHPDGSKVGFPLSDGTACIASINSKKRIILRGHRAEVNWFRFSRDGRFAATVSDDETVRLWDAHTGWPIWRAPLLRNNPPELFSHRGWLRLDNSPSTPHLKDARQKGTVQKWRKAVKRRARRAVESQDGKKLCLMTHDQALEIWDMEADKLLHRESLPGLNQVLAMPGGCITLAQGKVRLHRKGGSATTALQYGNRWANVVAYDRGEILIVAGRKVFVFGPSGGQRGSYNSDVGVTALARIGDWLILGFNDGNMELAPIAGPSGRLRHEQKKPTFFFEDVPSSPVVRLIAGPRGTLIVGFANGIFGLWSLKTGTRLEYSKLHGPVSHLLRRGNKLYAASELGQYQVLDLSIFYTPYCDLVKQVWEKVPVLWKEGLPILSPPPRKHRCSKGIGEVN